MSNETRMVRLRAALSLPAVVALLALLPLLGGLGACSSGTLLDSHDVGPEARYPVRGTSYYLPKTIVRIEVWQYGVTTDGKREIKHFAMFDDARDVKTIPDHRHQFVIRPRWDTASDDFVQVNMGVDGLLEGVHGRATDQRSEIARGLTDLFSMLVAGPGARSKWRPDEDQMRALTTTEDNRPRFVAEYEFDPVDPRDHARVKAALAGFKIDMTLTRQPDCPVAGSGPGCATTCSCTAPGIYYRLPIPYRFTLKPAGRFREPGVLGAGNEGEWESLDGGMERTLLMPNEAVCLYVPVNRASFVSSETSMVFERGMLREVKTDKPSELLGFVKIPVDMASAILAIPAELLTIRIRRIEQRSDLAAKAAAQNEAERQKLEAELAMLEAARKLRAPAADDAPAGDPWAK